MNILKLKLNRRLLTLGVALVFALGFNACKKPEVSDVGLGVQPNGIEGNQTTLSNILVEILSPIQ